ncbi:hypothetical protein MK489_12240 [Myxococcota bacterium]|nr:hypothetical protein [Myxococcota bacterium]
MRSYQVFANMSPECAERMLRALSDKSPMIFAQALATASAAMKARPVYLKRQPFPKRAAAVRRALSRVAANPIADEVLAIYFLECQPDLLTEWLDRVGLEHEEGSLKAETPEAPEEAALKSAIGEYLSADDNPDRPVLLQAFAAQAAIEWPVLDAQFEVDR